MISLTAGTETLAMLGPVKDLAEIRDNSGRPIGYYAPITVEHARRLAEATMRISPDELGRRWAAEHGQGRRTVEVFAHLLSLTKDTEMQAYLLEKIKEIAERNRCDTQ